MGLSAVVVAVGFGRVVVGGATGVAPAAFDRTVVLATGGGFGAAAGFDASGAGFRGVLGVVVFRWTAVAGGAAVCPPAARDLTGAEPLGGAGFLAAGDLAAGDLAAAGLAGAGLAGAGLAAAGLAAGGVPVDGVARIGGARIGGAGICGAGICGAGICGAAGIWGAGTCGAGI